MYNKFIVDTAEAKQVGCDPLDNKAAKVLLKFIWHMNKYGITKGTPNKLAQNMGISLWDFNHGVRALKKLNYIRKYTKWEYMVNPNIAGNGDDRQHYIVQHMWNSQTIEGSKE